MGRTPMLVEHLGDLCDWAKSDRAGMMYPCEKPSWRRLIEGPELWEGPYCKYHATRALNGAIAEIQRDEESY